VAVDLRNILPRIGLRTVKIRREDIIHDPP